MIKWNVGLILSEYYVIVAPLVKLQFKSHVTDMLQLTIK